MCFPALPCGPVFPALPPRLYRCIVRYGNLHGYYNLSAPKPPPLPDFPPGAPLSERQLVDSEFNTLRKEAILHFCTPVGGGRASVAVAVASSPASSAASSGSHCSTPTRSHLGRSVGFGDSGGGGGGGRSGNDLVPVSPAALLGGSGADLLEARQVASMGIIDELHSDDGEDDPSQPFSKLLCLC